MAVAILEIIAAALKLWESKEKRKYIDKMNQLRTDYYSEVNKPDNERSDLKLDVLEFEIKTLAKALALDIVGGQV